MKARGSRNLAYGFAVAVTFALAGCNQPSSGVILTYRVIGQCDSLQSSTDANGNIIADNPGSAYLLIDVFKVENNHAAAVLFTLLDNRISTNDFGSATRFDYDNIVHAPPFNAAPGTAATTLLPYVAWVSGFQNQDHPSQDAAQVNWHVIKFPGAELVKKPARQTVRSIGEERLDKAGPGSRLLGSAAEEQLSLKALPTICWRKRPNVSPNRTSITSGCWSNRSRPSCRNSSARSKKSTFRKAKIAELLASKFGN